MQALADAQITMPISEAREKVAEYLKSVRERHSKEDAAILRGYKELAKGHTVIDLPKCIRLGGVFEENGLPKLAVATASHNFVYARRSWNDSDVSFNPKRAWDMTRRMTKNVFSMPSGTLPEMDHNAVARLPRSRQEHPWSGNFRAMVPIVPPGLRPTFSLDGYATLFEVEEWALDPEAPRDPALLKHIGGDLYAVVATWDLTELERAVLSGRTR